MPSPARHAHGPLDRGESGVSVALQPLAMVTLPLGDGSGQMRLVTPDTPELRTARNVDTFSMPEAAAVAGEGTG